MDIRLPGMNGFEATQRIMTEKPTPIVVVSASVECADLQITMNALQAGALTVLEKPVGHDIRRIRSSGGAALHAARDHEPGKGRAQACSDKTRPGAANGSRAAHPASYRMLGIVSSTGGPNALVQLLERLGPDFPLPIALVQHITSSFLEGFASWLESSCPFSVEIVKDRVVPGAGKGISGGSGPPFARCSRTLAGGRRRSGLRAAAFGNGAF